MLVERQLLAALLTYLLTYLLTMWNITNVVFIQLVSYSSANCVNLSLSVKQNFWRILE